MLHEYRLLDIDVEGQVATITMHPLARGDNPPGPRPKRADELARALGELREDNSVRVVVLTGSGDIFTNPPTTAPWHGDPGVDWDGITGLSRALECIINMEKPVIAKVNGPAVGFGSSLVFGSDFVVAREDAIIADHHLGMGEVVIGDRVVGLRDRGVVPGDGGAVFVPLSMTPALAKEYLMLARPWTAKELASRGIINYAVPVERLEAKTMDLVEGLLRRNAYSLAWTKRVVNQHARMAYTMTFDAGAAYEFLGFYMQTEEAVRRSGGRGIDRL